MLTVMLDVVTYYDHSVDFHDDSHKRLEVNDIITTCFKFVCH